MQANQCLFESVLVYPSTPNFNGGAKIRDSGIFILICRTGVSRIGRQSPRALFRCKRCCITILEKPAGEEGYAREQIESRCAATYYELPCSFSSLQVPPVTCIAAGWCVLFLRWGLFNKGRTESGHSHPILCWLIGLSSDC